MIPKEPNNILRKRILRDFILDASDEELHDALAETNEDLDSLADSGRAVAKQALACFGDPGNVQDLHRGLGALVQMLRRREQVTVEELADLADVASDEIRRIELDSTYDPRPRTIIQLAGFFKIDPQSFVVLSGAKQVNQEVRDEVLRFAAKSTGMSKLSRDELKLLNEFVKLLAEHTAR